MAETVIFRNRVQLRFDYVLAQFSTALCTTAHNPAPNKVRGPEGMQKSGV